jgi:hypothetical protein
MSPVKRVIWRNRSANFSGSGVAPVFFALLAGHALADFPLQAGPIAVEKDRHSQSALQKSVPWYYWLTAHALCHGGVVYLITQSLTLGLLETVLHWLIDFAKCEKWFNIHVDQALHVLCKVAWCVMIYYGMAAELDAYLPTIARQW